MNICIFSATLDKNGGGPSRSVPILAKGLQSIGVNVTLITIVSPYLNLHALENSGVNIVVMPSDADIKDFEKVILDNNIDLIHSQGIWLPTYNSICKLARKLGIPYIMTPRGALEPWCIKSTNLWKRYKKKLAMLMYQRTDLQKAAMLLATSEMEANNLRALGLTSPIAVIPNGLIMDDYTCREIESISKVKKQVIFLSRIVPKKGIEYLLNSWKLLTNDFPDWNLIIVGNGEPNYINYLNNKIIDTKLNNTVKILKPAFGKEKYNLYTESSLFVLPTHSENFGMVIAEALACGVPAITTTGTPWESLTKTDSGWWIELSEDNLTKCMREAMNTPHKVLFEMGQRGAKMVRDNYDYIGVSKRMQDAYMWVLSGKSARNRPEFIRL